MKSPWEKSYTPVRFPSSGLNLTMDRFFLTAGSCFAQSLHTYLDQHFLQVCFSPQGISYNPLSLCEGLDLISGKSPFNQQDLFQQEGLWKHSLFHGSRNHIDRESYIKSIHRDLSSCRNLLPENPVLVLTLGTSWVYFRKSNGSVVNNCHRESPDLFERKLLKLDEMKENLSESLKQWKKNYPGSEVILTVSPVRHLRDDPRENSLSKARLICLSQEMAEQEDWIHYFPSYEIMLDELRDYRWYDKSLNHPTQQAIDYIMERFIEWSGSQNLKDWLKQAGKLRKRLNHRPGLSEIENKRFKEGTEQLIVSLKKSYPHFKGVDSKKGEEKIL